MEHYTWMDRWERMHSTKKASVWVIENSHYETDCCGVEIPYDDVMFDRRGNTQTMECPKCGSLAGIDVTEPDISEPDEGAMNILT